MPSWKSWSWPHSHTENQFATHANMFGHCNKLLVSFSMFLLSIVLELSCTREACSDTCRNFQRSSRELSNFVLVDIWQSLLDLSQLLDMACLAAVLWDATSGPSARASVLGQPPLGLDIGGTQDTFNRSNPIVFLHLLHLPTQPV